MKLVYCWIENYLGFNNQGFNFGSEYVYKHEWNQKNKELVITREINDKYIPDYFKFHGKGFENVTAIVGENGVGKSQLIRKLTHLLTENKIYRNNKYVLLFQCSELKIQTVYYASSDEISLTVKNESKEDLKLEKFDLKNSKTIFYSPIYDFNENYNKEDLIDVSSNNIMEDDQKGQKSSDFLKNHRLKEIQRILNFIGKIDKDKVEYFEKILKLPEFVEISFDKGIKNLQFDDLLTPQFVLDFSNRFKELFDIELSDFNDSLESQRQKAVNSFLYVVINSTLYYLENLSNHNLNGKLNAFEPEYGIVSGETFKEYVINNLGIFSKFYGENGNIFELKIDLLNDIIKQIENQSDNKIVSEKKILVDFKIAKDIAVKYQSQNYGYLDFNFYDISSGEKAFLNLYSRLFEAQRQITGTPKNVFLLIDEGEHGFHVKWQQEYLVNLIHASNLIFKRYLTAKSKIQLIFATHSPITISDLPNSNIIYLKKEEVKTKVSKETFPTFAANIHDILKHEFFMDSGFIGSYIKFKIDDCIEVLRMKIDPSHNSHETGSSSSERNKRLTDLYPIHSINQIIKNIDEPILKIKLNELYFLATEGSAEKGRLKAQQEIIDKRLKELKDDKN